MSITGKGKYDGKKKIELDSELALPPNSEIVFTVEEVAASGYIPKKTLQNEEEHFLLQIAKNAVHLGRSDLSETYHEILYNLESENG